MKGNSQIRNNVIIFGPAALRLNKGTNPSRNLDNLFLNSSRPNGVSNYGAIFLITVVALTTIASSEPMQHALEPWAAKAVVQRLVVGLDTYIFPEKAKVLKAYLQQHMEAYESINTPDALAEKLTSDMRAVAVDKHLAVFYSGHLKEDTKPSGLLNSVHPLIVWSTRMLRHGPGFQPWRQRLVVPGR